MGLGVLRPAHRALMLWLVTWHCHLPLLAAQMTASVAEDAAMLREATAAADTSACSQFASGSGIVGSESVPCFDSWAPGPPGLRDAGPCGRGYDERFSWRMFSPTRMVRCEYAFTANGRPVRLGQKFHQAWLNLVRRGRPDVVEGIVAKLCADKDTSAVTVRLECTKVDGNKQLVHEGDENLCSNPSGGD